MVSEALGLLDRADTAAGGDAVTYLQGLILGAEQETLVTFGTQTLELGNAPPYPVRYAATIQRTNALILRGETMAYGEYDLFVPRSGRLVRVDFYDPRSNQYGSIRPRLTPEWQFRLPRFTLHPIPPDELDSDHDGLPDIVEGVYGTDFLKPDSDLDGVKDGAEIAQGTDPLDGRPTRTGIIANVKTPGPALDVCAANQLVVVAEGARGIAIFKVEPGKNAIITAQVDTPGNAQRITCGGNLVAVADGNAGLAIIGIADPPAARVIFQLDLGGPVQCVALNGTIAYAGLASGNAGQIVTVDCLNGRVLDRKNVSAPVNDLSLGNEYLYALLFNRVITYPLDAGLPLSNVTSVDSPYYSTGNIRIFAGANVAYATHPRGYNTFSLTNPALPALIAPLNSGQFGWKQIVPNGSGLAVAAVSPNSSLDSPTNHNVSLYDVSIPEQTDVFITQFITPGFARAVSIYDGLAYVADDAAGLQVINYRAYDILGVPPTITLATSAPTNGIEEGRLFRVTASVLDDVQVRNVEFYVDGQRTLIDGNFPFELRGLTPKWSPGKTNFILQSLAGGNTNWSAPLVIPLFHESIPPSMLLSSPYDGGFLAQTDPPVFFARFSEALNPDTINNSNLRFTAAGPDGTHGTLDDATVNAALIYREELGSITFTAVESLPAGMYRVAISSNLTDHAGNRLANPANIDFRVVTNYLIAYSVAGAPQGTNWLMLSDGSYDQPVTEGEWPRLSPNGRYLAFHRGTNAEMARRDIWVRDLALGTEGPVLALGAFTGQNFVWTPDSQQLILEYGGSIYRMDYDGANRVRIGGCADTTQYWPSLNPVDGSFALGYPPLSTSSIRYANPQVSSCEAIPNAIGFCCDGHVSVPSWSPDGLKIAFLRGRASSPILSGLATTYEGNINIVRTDGSDKRQLTFFNLPYPEFIGPEYLSPALVWTPAGDAIITAGRIAGEYGIFRVDSVSGAITKIKSSPSPINYVGSYQVGAPPLYGP